ncbi:MAG: carboxypeptidase-like regulatory domain-containing protein [Vicinamibacterales bacterium]|nr:carboxypeptidase-like regulatory domain-containing protein [Vicinamibacterales bacterium]MDP7670827.1 carboxypeptidase-like regulatory domain-containing protein [Vicinamibacterales bacterium]
MTGVVVAADTGQPVRYAYLRVTSGELRGWRAAVTEANGRYRLEELPPGRYTVTASKTGFVSVTFGQRRVLEPGTPLEVGEGETLDEIDLALPRGSVITGQVVDEVGEPLAGVGVRAMRHEYRQGERRLAAVGANTSDDRGQYRVYGLAPGTYYVSAVARFIDGGGQARGRFGRASQVEQDMGYAPSYYPGITSAAQAMPLTVGLAQEMTGVSFGVQLVPTVRVAGLVLSPEGAPATRSAVSFVPDGGARGFGGGLDAQTQSDGTFTVRNVPPGRYLAVARSGGRRRENPLFAVQSITVAGSELSGLTMMLSAGATISGSVVFESNTLPPDDALSRVRISTRPLQTLPFGTNGSIGVGANGIFRLTTVPMGAHLFQVDAPDPWLLKTIYVDGRDMTDAPLELTPRVEIENVSVVLTDQVSELSGLVSDGTGRPVSELTVLVFSTDPELWRSQSRQVAVGRPDQNGHYQVRGLPAGEYYVVGVDGIEQGSWFDPAVLGRLNRNADRLRIREGEILTHDLRVDLPS